MTDKKYIEIKLPEPGFIEKMKSGEYIFNKSFLIPKECLSDNKINSLITCGSQGCTFTISNSDNIIKIIPIQERENYITDIINESKITKFLGEIELAPKLINYFDCSGKSIYENEKGKIKQTSTEYFMIVLERFDYTLKKYKEKFKDKYDKNKIKQLVEKGLKQLHKNNIAHGDLHMDNIMVNTNDKDDITKLVFIDFGKSKLLDKYSEEAKKRLIKDDLSFLTAFI